MKTAKKTIRHEKETHSLLLAKIKENKRNLKASNIRVMYPKTKR